MKCDWTKKKEVYEYDKELSYILFRPKKSEKINLEGNLFCNFVKHGMDPKDLTKKCITFRMVEKVLNDQRISKPEILNYKQINIILKSVKKRMQVDYITNKERIVESFCSSQIDDKLGFGKWLAYKIELSYVSYANENLQKNLKDKDPKSILNYINEERILMISCALDEFSQNNLNQRVYIAMKEVDKNSYTIEDFINCLHKCTTYFIPLVDRKLIEMSVFMFFLDLINHDLK